MVKGNHLTIAIVSKNYLSSRYFANIFQLDNFWSKWVGIANIWEPYCLDLGHCKSTLVLILEQNKSFPVNVHLQREQSTTNHKAIDLRGRCKQIKIIKVNQISIAREFFVSISMLNKLASLEATLLCRSTEWPTYWCRM